MHGVWCLGRCLTCEVVFADTGKLGTASAGLSRVCQFLCSILPLALMPVLMVQLLDLLRGPSGPSGPTEGRDPEVQVTAAMAISLLLMHAV